MANDEVTRQESDRPAVASPSQRAAGSRGPGADRAAQGAAGVSRPAMCNDEFYTNGQFDEQKAKEGVLALCRSFGYPVFPGMIDNLWVSDYGTGQFSQLGLAACIFANHHDEAGTYMLLDLFLLPNQILPEHWHLKGDHDITKTEGWLVRWGEVYIVGAGEDNLAEFPQIKIPAFHCQGGARSRHVVEGRPGTFTPLTAVGTRHWQYGGPNGAIITEVANFHTSEAVRHSDPDLNAFFLGT